MNETFSGEKNLFFFSFSLSSLSLLVEFSLEEKEVKAAGILLLLDSFPPNHFHFSQLIGFSVYKASENSDKHLHNFKVSKLTSDQHPTLKEIQFTGIENREQTSRHKQMFDIFIEKCLLIG